MTIIDYIAKLLMFIEGAGGITGGYNKTTGCGYVQFSDGRHQKFQI